ncbi:MAG: methyltransferase domain-containing protein [Candidatus Competibacterales bacterium]
MADRDDALPTPETPWTFAGDIAHHFDHHISRSVPLYHQGHAMVVALANFFLPPNATAFELGCSTGTLSARLAKAYGDRPIALVAMDKEPAMVEAAKAKTRDLSGVDIQQQDILEADFAAADLIIAYYTVQFVHPSERGALFERIFRGLKGGGGFILFEKVRAPDARFQDIASALYTDFKLAQGFSEAEIIAKSRSLQGILEPHSSQKNLALLTQAGFGDVMTVFKYACFEGFLAIK